MVTGNDLSKRLDHESLKGIFEKVGFSKKFTIDFPEKEKMEGMYRFVFFTHPMFDKASNDRYEFALLNIENSFSKKIFFETYFVMLSKKEKNSYIILKKFSSKESFESRARVVDFHDKITVMFTWILDAVEYANQISQIKITKAEARRVIVDSLMIRMSYPYSSIRDSSIIDKSSIKFTDEIDFEGITISDLFFLITDRAIHFEKRSISFKRTDSDELFTTGGFLIASKRYYYFMRSLSEVFDSFADKMIAKYIE